MPTTLWSDKAGIVHLGPDDGSWDSYTLCTSRGFVHQGKSLFRVMGVDRFATCIMCLGYRRDDD
jgi:hypothetical protein